MRSPVLVVVLLALAGCLPAETPPLASFTKVDVTATPETLTVLGDTLLIGVHRDGKPELYQRQQDGKTTQVAARSATPYGAQAHWYSVATDGTNVVALGGERGGAHGNVRWSAWDGTPTGISEKPQGFSTFGGYGAGELIDAVFTPSGPVLVGTWSSARVSLDVAVWTFDGTTWTRQNSAGTALESAQGALGFPMAAAALGQDVLIAGWQLGNGAERPVVWRSVAGQWTSTALPADRAGAALAVRCWDSTCAVAGRVDGKLAVWRLSGGSWSRVEGLPAIAVGDELVAPFEVAGTLTVVVPDGDQVKIVQEDGQVIPAREPKGQVTAATVFGDSVYVLSGPDENTRTLWKLNSGELN